MVRTRATRIKPDPDGANNKESQDSAYGSPTLEDRPRGLLVADFKRQMEAKRRNLQEQFAAAMANMESQCNMIKLKIGPIYGNMLFSDFIKGDIEAPEPDVSFAKPSSSSAPSRNFATSTARKARDSLLSPEVQRITRQSRQKSMLARSISESNISAIVVEETTVKAKTTRRTRSVSNRRQATVQSIYETPANKNRVLTAVTPKADPASTALKRHPRVGEFALSMTGSPLMIPGSYSETNITLPLGNGEVYSILPTDDFVPGIIPAIDERTKKQIQQLQKNLSRLLQQ